MKSFPDVCYLMNQIVILKQPVFECIQIIVGVFHLSRISPGNFFHVFHGECFSIFQPTYNQEFLYPANGKQCHFHFGTDHIVIDCSTEISIDKYFYKFLRSPDRATFRLHRVSDSTLDEDVLSLEVPAVLFSVDSIDGERLHLLLFQKDVLR